MAANTLDQLDLLLIRELEIDARRSYLAMAAKLGTTSGIVRRRLQRLLDERIIAIFTMTDPFAMGYAMLATLWINVVPGKVDVVADKLASLRNVQHIRLITGRYDMVATVVFRDPEDMLNMASEEIGNIPDVIHIETMMILKLVKNSWAYLGTDWKPVKQGLRHREFDDLDRLLITELKLSPRQTVTEIATKLGINRSTAGRKLQTLLDDGLVRVVSIPNATALGYSIQVLVLVKILSGKIHAVADEVARHEQVRHVSITAGQSDLTVWAAFRDMPDLHQFIGYVGTIPGVLSHETLMTSKVVKPSWDL